MRLVQCGRTRYNKSTYFSCLIRKFDDLCSAVLDHGDLVCDSCIGLFSCVFCGKLGSLCHDLLFIFREIFEEIIVDDQRDQMRKMIGLDHIILLFI